MAPNINPNQAKTRAGKHNISSSTDVIESPPISEKEKKLEYFQLPIEVWKQKVDL